jgi:hypothetical protein
MCEWLWLWLMAGRSLRITIIIDLGRGLDREKMKQLVSLLALARPWIVVLKRLPPQLSLWTK